VPGFTRFENIIQREVNNEVQLPDSLLEVRDGIIYVTDLNEPLEHVSAELRFALDETPIVPDAPMLKAYTTSNRVPLSRGRASIWTLLPVLSANGNVIATLLLQRCQSVPVDVAKFVSMNNLCISATENAQQSDVSWLNFAEVWLPLCGTTWENPGFVYIDGHSSHITRAFIHLAAKHAIYVVVEPSHTSIILQVADVGINRFLKTRYCQEYTASICASGVTGKVFDDAERIGCVVRTLLALQASPELITSCFHKAGLLTGYNDISSHFAPAKFNAGVLEELVSYK